MPHATRLLLTPVPRPAPAGVAGPPATVTGVTLKLAPFGPDRSGITVATQPAQIELIGRFFKSVRNAPSERVQSLGIIKGEIWVQGRPPRARFQCDPASLEALSAAAQSDPNDPNADRYLPRALDILLDAESFLPCPSVAPQLTLPDFAPQYPYLEVMAELKVGAVLEAPRGDNDILDVPIWHDSPARARAYQLQIIDEVGEPLSDATIRFDYDGKSATRATDTKGKAAALSQNSATALARILDAASLKAKLKTRWNSVRGKPVLDVDAPLANRFTSELDTGISVTTSQPCIVCVRPKVTLARLVGWVFDKNKSFVLPHVMSGLRDMAKLCAQNPKSSCLLVGHTDTSGEPDINDPLSLERAESLKAFFSNDVAAWQKRYDSSNSESRRWGDHEDALMLQSVGGADVAFAANPILAYQQFHNALPADRQSKHHETLKEDGKSGSNTRKQLIADYMNSAGTSVPDDTKFVTHGCGENFPLDASGDSLDSMPVDGADEPMDRRVELYLFDEEFGIQPPAPGKNSKSGSQEYLEWRRRAQKAMEVVSQRGQIDVQVRLGQPYRYRLTAGDFMLLGEKPADASITAEIPIVSAQAQLFVEELQSGATHTWPISLQQLDGVAAVSGMQQRLANLGYYVGPIDGQLSEETQWSLTAFQHDQGLPETGNYDSTTQAALEKAHDA